MTVPSLSRPAPVTNVFLHGDAPGCALVTITRIAITALTLPVSHFSHHTPAQMPKAATGAHRRQGGLTTAGLDFCAVSPKNTEIQEQSAGQLNL